MKKLLFCTFLNLIFFSSIAQVWSPKQSIPGGGSKVRMASISFSNSQGSAFVLGGLYGNTVINDFWQYNAVDDSWTQKPNFPGGSKYAHISFVVDSIAYVGTGSNQFGNLSTQFWAYNMNTKVWSTIANFPGEGRVYASAMTINSKGYIGGGVKFVGGNVIYLKDFWEYDPALDTWTQKSDYLGGVRAGTIAFGEAGKGYMGYGESSGFFHWDFHEYDPSNDSWTLLTGFPSTSMSFVSVVTLGNKAYILGGEFQDHVYTDKVWEYTASTNEWKPLTSFPGTPRRNAISFALGGEVYYGTGQTGGTETNVTDDLWVLGDLFTSVSDPLFNARVKVFPNPFQNNLMIDSSEDIKTLKIYSILGTVVYSSVNFKNQEIDLSFLNRGMYLLKIETYSGQIIEEKVTKL